MPTTRTAPRPPRHAATTRPTASPVRWPSATSTTTRPSPVATRETVRSWPWLKPWGGVRREGRPAGQPCEPEQAACGRVPVAACGQQQAGPDESDLEPRADAVDRQGRRPQQQGRGGERDDQHGRSRGRDQATSPVGDVGDRADRDDRAHPPPRCPVACRPRGHGEPLEVHEVLVGDVDRHGRDETGREQCPGEQHRPGRPG